ncbi:YacL family protein [Thalassotalea sp. PS06]|uniref:UPF0231 family protein n=1 Tax=Thalassotalea sp. PS06 TaxID=2594005 RepID=UPI00116236F6|nr:YacL family protein [Thalassotalea sp. PS06]QDP00378.1 UPF0231 family protein [Thalassotalea sp. PS06]
MEYEFNRDFIDGSPKAKFSFGHETVGFWLEQEIGRNVSKLSVVREQLQQIINDGYGQLQIPGKEFSLEADIQDVTITANDGFADATNPSVDEEPDDGAEQPDDEFEQDQSFSFAQCGLEDFADMLDSWLEFLN